ncbi:MAG: ImmA/IrrE family metallo-endopeptidase [Ferruginibacter sp.]
MSINFNINILRQLVEQHPQKGADVKAKFPRINEWQQETQKPTINQLIGLASYFHIPFGYFFLKKMPIEEYPIPHYRTKGNVLFEPSQELLETIQIIEHRQNWAKDVLIDRKENPLSFANSITIKTPIKTAAQIIRDTLGVHENWAKHTNFDTWYDAFKFLVSRVEYAGMYVVINGIVANNTHSKLDTNEFRGFVLFDEYAPFIFINNNDFISAKIFTLIHEVAHVLIGKSASFDYHDLQPANNAIEEFCDAVAAEFLVPAESLLHYFKKAGKDYQALAQIYKVSKIVIIRRLLDLEKISYSEFIDALKSFRVYKTELQKQPDDKKGGGDFYNTAPYRISKRFFNLIYNAIQQDRVLYREAFRLTGLTPRTFDGYVERFITKAPND